MLAFFGLAPENKDIILEQIFILIYYCGFTYQDAKILPVHERTWFINRVIQEFTRQQKSAEENNTPMMSKAAHQNTPETRQMLGMSRLEGPNRTRRFT